MAIDAWAELPERCKYDKRERFNYIMAKIEGISSSDKEEEETPSSNGNVSVTVKDEVTNKPVANANVDIHDENETVSFDGVTGSAGGCTIKNVPFGEYQITTTAEGYTDDADSIIINDEEMSVEIKLSRIIDDEF